MIFDFNNYAFKLALKFNVPFYKNVFLNVSADGSKGQYDVLEPFLEACFVTCVEFLNM